MSMEVDASEFLRGLDLANVAVRDAAARGMTEAMLDLERRAKEATPVDQGTLMRGIHARTNEIVAETDKIEGVVATGAESSDYAIVQHEDVLQHTHPVAGTYAAKYMEKPLKEMSGRYARGIADRVKERIGE